MANYCNYEIHVKGSKKAALMIFAIMPWANDKYIEDEFEEDGKYIVQFIGDCKWSVDTYCKNSYEGNPIDLENYNEDDLRDLNIGDAELELLYYTLRVKSEIFHCEIQVYSYSEESEFCSFEHYNNGNTISRNSGKFSETENLEWYLDEFPTYEEFCEYHGLSPDFIANVDIELEKINDNFYIVHIPDQENNFTYNFDF